jgi:hypothetical protein
MWTESKETVYGNVILFVKKFRKIATRKIVYGYIIADCLRGNAVAWYESANPKKLKQAGIK